MLGASIFASPSLRLGFNSLLPTSSGGSSVYTIDSPCTNLRYLLRHIGYTTRNGRRRCTRENMFSNRALLALCLHALRIYGGLQISVFWSHFWFLRRSKTYKKILVTDVVFCSVWLSNLLSPGRPRGTITKGRFLMCGFGKLGYHRRGAGLLLRRCRSGHLGLVHISTCLRVCLLILYGWDDSRQSRVVALDLFVISHCRGSYTPGSREVRAIV